jgi:hypothetical protein
MSVLSIQRKIQYHHCIWTVLDSCPVLRAQHEVALTMQYINSLVYSILYNYLDQLFSLFIPTTAYSLCLGRTNVLLLVRSELVTRRRSLGIGKIDLAAESLVSGNKRI